MADQAVGSGKALSDSALDRYAVRRLNPFLGLVEVVEIAGARALSSDGVNWQIQILADRPEHTWGSPNQYRPLRQYFRFGAWSEREGLVCVPVNPLLDVGAMLAAADRLLPQIAASLGHLPFPLRDRFEHWLLDRSHRPLALVGSAVEERFIEELVPDGWHAALPAEPPFVSPTLKGQEMHAASVGNRHRHAQRLEQLVADAAGTPARWQWFERLADGCGRGLGYGVPADLDGRSLSAAAFPRLQLRADWSDSTTAAVTREYLDWCAPRLLALPVLSVGERRHLEHAARRRAELVDRLYRLYPAILDRELIDAARVEARLRRTAESA